MQTQDSMKLEQPIEHRCRGSRIQASVLKQNADLQSGLLHLSTGRDVDCNQPTSFCLCCIMALHLATGRDADCNVSAIEQWAPYEHCISPCDEMRIAMMMSSLSHSCPNSASHHGARCGLQLRRDSRYPGKLDGSCISSHSEMRI